MKYVEQIFKPLKYHQQKRDCNFSDYLDDNHRLYDVGDLEKEFVSKSCRHGMKTVWDAVTENFINVSKFNLIPLEKTEQLLKIIEEDKIAFNKSVIQRFLNQYRVQTIDPTVDFNDILYLVRQKIKKLYPSVLKYFDALYPDKRDVVEGVERFLRFHINNTNKEEWAQKVSLFNKNGYIISKTYASLELYGYVSLPGFRAAWDFVTRMNNIAGTIV